MGFQMERCAGIHPRRENDLARNSRRGVNGVLNGSCIVGLTVTNGSKLTYIQGELTGFVIKLKTLFCITTWG
jgi:hypothetical protein